MKRIEIILGVLFTALVIRLLANIVWVRKFQGSPWPHAKIFPTNGAIWYEAQKGYGLQGIVTHKGGVLTNGGSFYAQCREGEDESRVDGY
jgi:hypothetical protein